MSEGVVISSSGVLLMFFYMKVWSQSDTDLLGQSCRFATITIRVIIGSLIGFLYFLSFSARIRGPESLIDALIIQTTVGSLTGAFTCIPVSAIRFQVLLPDSIWSCLSILFIVSQTIGFASNSYTVWEDSILFFFQATIGFTAAFRCLRQSDPATRTYGIYQSIAFIMLGRVAFYSQRCREEQMPYCHTTYFGTSGNLAVSVPVDIAIILPMIAKRYLLSHTNRSSLMNPRFHSFAFFGLLLNAIVWALITAENGEWFESLPGGLLKAWRIRIAQLVLVVSFPASIATFI